VFVRSYQQSPGLCLCSDLKLPFHRFKGTGGFAIVDFMKVFTAKELPWRELFGAKFIE
jgi:hypothetical protein